MNSFLRHLFSRLFWVPLTTVLFAVFGSSVMANDGLDKDLPAIGKPVPNGLNFQPPVTELARDIQWLDNVLLVIIMIKKDNFRVIHHVELESIL